MHRSLLLAVLGLCARLVASPASAQGNTLWYEDADGDGYGNDDVYVVLPDTDPQPAGYVLWPGDCDDTDFLVSPGQAERCDGLDNNCNNDIDEGLILAFYSR